jgi:hypothetical protein
LVGINFNSTLLKHKKKTRQKRVFLFVELPGVPVQFRASLVGINFNSTLLKHKKKTRQKRVFLFVELPGVEPGSGEGKDGAFFMFSVS